MVALTNSHTTPAPGVYLCQVNETTACGACCGLYNVSDNSRHGVETLLQGRTARFAEVPRKIAALDLFADWSAKQAGPGPLADFHHCPFLGLIGENSGRVGCLLHPLAAGNQGVDLRGLSYYGSFTCRTYFCKASRRLARRYQQLLRGIFDHWYPYGMVVTETRLVSRLLGAVEKRLGHLIDPAGAAERPRAGTALKRLLSIKMDWPYRRRPEAARVHYLFNDGVHRRPPFASTLEGGAAEGWYQTVFTELASSFSDPAQERAARHEIEYAINAAADAFSEAVLPAARPVQRHSKGDTPHATT